MGSVLSDEDMIVLELGFFRLNRTLRLGLGIWYFFSVLRASLNCVFGVS